MRVIKKVYLLVGKNGNHIKLYQMKHYAEARCYTYLWGGKKTPNGNKVLVSEVKWEEIE